MATFEGSILARFARTTSPASDHIRSEGADVAGTASMAGLVMIEKKNAIGQK
jgi:hypothetical protein